MSHKLLAVLLALPIFSLTKQVSASELGNTCLLVDQTGPLDTGHDTGGLCEAKPSGGGGDNAVACYSDLICQNDPNSQPQVPDQSTPNEADKVIAFVDPVTGDGEFFTTATDLSYPGFGINFEFKRSYRSRTSFFGPLGHAWDHSYNRRLFGDSLGHAYCDGSIDYSDGKVGGVHFKPLHNDIIRIVANTIVDKLARITTPIALLPHRLIRSLPVVDPGPTPPPVGTPVIPPPGTTTTRIDYAAGEGSTLTLTYDSSQPNPWAMRDLSGVISYFDANGLLAVMQHPAGPKMTFTWAKAKPESQPHLTQIVDTTGRTIYLNYGVTGEFLACLSKDTTCTNPLVSYGIDYTKPGYGELVAAFVGDGSSNEGTTRYVYHHGEKSSSYVPNELAATSCESLCSARTQTQCRNEDVCHFNACATMAGSDYTAALAACMGYCMPGCFASCKNAGPTAFSDGSDYTCHKHCELTCGSPCLDLNAASQSCYLSLPAFCTAPDCKASCTQRLSTPLPDAPTQDYFVGVREDLNHNIEQVIDNQGRLVVKNTYGTNPNDESFDKIINQQVGDVDAPESHAQFEYHDLKLEAQEGGNWSFNTKPSTPNPAVTSLSSFTAKVICPQSCGPGSGVNGCVSPTVTYGAAFDRPLISLGTAAPAPQVPRYATVITDLGGVVKTSYFDDHWRVLREVDVKGAQREETNYNYKNGFLVGKLNPSGDRVCTEMAGMVPSQVTRLPAAGFAGAQDPMVTTMAYDAAAQVTDVATDPSGTNIRVHYERDNTERVKWIDKSVDASTTERTTYDYDPGMPGPKAVTSPGGSVTTYTSYDPIGAAPQLVSVGADGAAPIQTYSAFNADGRVVETGKPNLAATRYQYALTGRPTLVGKRYDGTSAWQDATSSFAPRALQPLTTVGVRVTTVKYFNPQGDVAWKGEQPNDGSLPMRFTCYHYDGEGHLLETILPEGNSIVTTYDVAWRPLSASQGMRGTAPTEPWATKCAANTSNWSGALETLSSASFAPGGWPQSKTVEGVTTTYVTDGFGRAIEERDPTGGVRRRGYDRQGRVAWEAILQPSAAATPYVKPQPDINSVAQMTEYAYDHLGRTTTVSRWHVEDHTALVKTTGYRDLQRTVVETEGGLTSTTVFDGAGRPVIKILPDGSTVTFSYAGSSGSIVTKTSQTNNPNKPTTVETTTMDGMGFAASAVDDQNTLEHAEGHDIEGHLVWTKDLAGNALTTLRYDGLGRLHEQDQTFVSAPPPFFAKPTVTATYGYDRNDRRTAVVDGRGNAIAFAYDSLDRLSVKTDPTGKQTLFQYYVGSRRIYVQTDPSGTTFTRTYDPLGRAFTETTAPGAGLDVGVRKSTFAYDVTGRVREVDYSGAGLQGWDNSVTMQFDSLGRKLREASSLFGFDVQHSYDLNGRWKTTNIAGATEQQSFDSLGRLTDVAVNNSHVASYSYGATGMGGPLSASYVFRDNFHVQRTHFTYDQRNRQTDLTVNKLTWMGRQFLPSPLLSMHSALGADGIPRERVYTISGAGSRTIANAFQVDNFGRVTGESLDIHGASPLTGDVSNDSVTGWMLEGARFRSYTLDGASNWQSWSDNQAGVDSPSVDARNAYLSFAGKEPLYDSADNAVSIPDATGDEAYTWDVYKHPLSVAKAGKSASFIYDGLGRRIVEQDASGAHFLLWDGNRLAARGTSRTDASHWTLEVGGAGIDDHVASVDELGTGAIRVYHQTVDGSVIGVSDANGLVESYSYSAYGELSIYGPDGASRTDSSLGTRFLYHGQLFDPWTKTYSMRAREYRPTWGRFLSTDPIGLDGGLNLYAFVSGRTLHLRDPMGTDARAQAYQDVFGVHMNLLLGGDMGCAFTDSCSSTPSAQSTYGWSAMVGSTALVAIPEAGLVLSLLASFEGSTAGNDLDERGVSNGRTQNEDARLAMQAGLTVVLGSLLGPLGKSVSEALGEAAGDVIPGLFMRAEADGLSGAATWGRPETLADHFARHGGDFGAATADDYAQRASDFLIRSQAEGLPTKIAEDGVIRVYDPASNAFGSYNANGTTRTFFKPDAGQAYWDRQPGISQ